MTRINELRQRLAVVGMPSDFGKPKPSREAWNEFLINMGEKPKDIPPRSESHQRQNISNKPTSEVADSILENFKTKVDVEEGGFDARKIPTERVNSEGFKDDDETGYSPENAKKWAKLKQRLARIYAS